MTDTGAAAVYRAYIDAERRRDEADMLELLAPGVVIEINGRAALDSADEDAAAVTALFDAYPDYRRELIEVIGEGNRAAARWRMIGHPREDLRSRLSDLDIAGCSVVHVADGRITRAYVWSPSTIIEDILAQEHQRT